MNLVAREAIGEAERRWGALIGDEQARRLRDLLEALAAALAARSAP